jgi:NAD(P)-dependent dehydrogenase (short-subunit alcohol dehydrogenase family)
MIDLTGRTALVTGAGRNVGAGIAATLARCGAAVAVNDLVPERAEAVVTELRAGDAEAIAVPADVTDNAAVEAMVRAVADQLGAIDILVNNAGVPADGAPAVRSARCRSRTGIATSTSTSEPCCRAPVPCSTTCAIGVGVAW